MRPPTRPRGAAIPCRASALAATANAAPTHAQPSLVRPVNLGRVEARLLGEFDEIPARVDQSRQRFELFFFDRLEVGTPDATLAADVGQLQTLRLAHLPKKRACELGVRTDLALQLLLQHQLLGG